MLSILLCDQNRYRLDPDYRNGIQESATELAASQEKTVSVYVQGRLMYKLFRCGMIEIFSHPAELPEIP